MNNLILNSATSFSQKVILFGVGILLFVGGGLSYLYLLFCFLGIMEYSGLGIFDIITLFLFFVSFLLFAVAFLKEGLTFENNEALKSYFLFKRKVTAKKINLDGIKEMTIMKFDMARKVAMFTTPNPEQTEDYAEYRVYGLNENHSKRVLVYNATSTEQAKLIANALAENLSLSLVAYNPPRLTKRR